MDIYVKVTMQNIEDGLPFQSGLCPVALAVSDELKRIGYPIQTESDDNVATIEVGTNAIFIDGDKVIDYWDFPELDKWISKFDNHEQVLPIEFDFYLDWEPNEVIS